MATNPFDFNASADEAFLSGAKSSEAMGFPQQQQTIGMQAPPAGLTMPRTQAALASIRPPTPPQAAGPVIGYNPSTDTYFSGGKEFSGSNLSVIDQADKVGLLNINNTGRLPAGYHGVTADEVRARLARKADERGFFSAVGETAKQAGMGIADLGSMVTGAAAFYAPKGSIVESVAGSVNEAIEGAVSQDVPDVYGRGVVGRSFVSGARGLAPSAAGMAASVAFPVAGTAGTGAVFGGAQGWQTYQKALAEGKTPEQAMEVARRTGLIEGAGEAIADRFGGAAFKGLAGITKGGSRVAVNLLANPAVQMGTEYGQTYGVAATERAYGLSAPDPHEAGVQGMEAAAGMTALMGIAGLGVGAVRSNMEARLQKDLLQGIQQQEYTAPPPPPAPYQIAGQQAQQVMAGKVPSGLGGYSDLATQQTYPGMMSEGYTQAALDALNGMPTQADNLAQQKATSQSLAAQRAASAVGQQWQDLQAQREQERLNQLWPAAVAGQEWQSLLNQKPVGKRDFEAAMDPDVMSGVDPFAAPAAAPASDWAPTPKPFAAPLDTRMLPKSTIAPVSPSGESAPAVAAPASPAPATEQGLSQPDETATVAEDPKDPDEDVLKAKAADIKTGKVKARSTTRALDKPERLALVRAINGKITDAVRTVLGAKTADTIRRAQALATERMAILDMISAGRKITRNKKRPDEWITSKKNLRDMREEDVQENLDTAYEDLLQKLSANAKELITALQALEGDVGRPALNAAQLASKKTASGGVQTDPAMFLSRAYRDYVEGQMTPESPVPGPKVGVTRERKELGAMADTKWASVFHQFTYGSKKYSGVEAVLMKIRHHSGNPLLAGIASRLYRMGKSEDSEGFTPPKMVFYSAEGRQDVSDAGVVTLNTEEKFQDLPGYSPKTRAMYVASTNTIHVGPDGMGADTILHELIHAYLIGYVRANPNSAEVKALNDLRLHVVKELKKIDTKEAKKLVSLLEDSAHGLDEFLAYGLTEDILQQYMMKMPGLKGHGYFRDAWNAFAALIRKVFGIPADDQKAFSQFLLASGDMLERGYAVPMAVDRTMESRKVGPKVGYDKIADFFKRITSTPSGNLFQTSKMDESYGKPRKAFTMDEILAHHLQGDWKITPAKEGAPNPDGTRVVRGWELENRNEKEGGKFGIYENERGEVTVQSPEAIAGKSRGSAVLQAALAYAFYNDKLFVNELEGFGMTDAAVTRYAEAMMSAAVKYGTTDFMRPHARQIDPSTRGPEDSSQGGDAFTENAQFYKWGLKGWKNSDAKGSMESRFENNVNLLAKMLTSMAFAAKPELESYSFYADEGFTDKDGNPAKGLTATQKRAIMINSIAGMSEGSATAQGAGVALMDDEQRKEADLDGLFYSTALSPAPVNSLGLSQYAPTKPILQPLFEAMLPMFYGANPKLREAGNKWVEERMSWLAEKAPDVAAYFSYLFPDMNVSSRIADIVLQAKAERQSPTTAANELGGWIKTAKNDDIQQAFDYMDALYADPDAPMPAGMPEHVESIVKAALAELQPVLAATAQSNKNIDKAFKHLKPSEMLVRAYTADMVAATRFGGDPEKILKGKKEMVREQDVTAPSPGGTMKTGRFYPVFGKDGKIKEMVQETAVGNRTDVDKNRLFRFDKVNKEGDWIFREATTVKGLLANANAETKDTIATSFLNFVSIMANAVASRNMARSILDAEQGRNVFKDEEALLAHLQKTDPTKTSVHVRKLGQNESRNERVKREDRKPGNWVKVPASEAYGKLAGKVVAGPIWARIEDSTNREPLVKWKLFNDIMRAFKASKTRYSPSTMATNVMSNVTLSHLNNIPYEAVRDAMGLYLKYKLRPHSLKPEQLRVMTAFHASGATLGDWSTNEIKQVMYEALAQQSERGGDSALNSVLQWANYHNRVLERAGEIAKRSGARLDDVMSSAYATGDNMFRLAAFMSEYGRLERDEPGLPQKEMLAKAGKFAKEAFLDYDTDSRFVNALRQTMLPFVSFTYAFSGKILKTARDTPWKLATLAMMYSVVMAAANAALGDEDEEKRRKRDKMDDRTWFGAYKQLRVGDTYFDLAKWFVPVPWDFRDSPNGFLGIQNWPSAITPNNPFFTLLMYSFGYDPYTGQRFTKESLSTFENVKEITKKMGGVFAPPWATKLGGPKPGLTGEAESYYTYYARAALLPIKEINEKEATAALGLRIKQVDEAYKKELYSQARAAATGKISREELEDARKKLMQRREEELAELKKGL